MVPLLCLLHGKSIRCYGKNVQQVDVLKKSGCRIFYSDMPDFCGQDPAAPKAATGSNSPGAGDTW